jgi:hypothetical protein
MDRRTFLIWTGLSFLAASLSQLAFNDSMNGSDAVVFYLAPNGRDSWSGKLEEPNSEQTDGPFATLGRARNAIRQLKEEQGGTIKQPISVVMRDGTYFLKQTLILEPIDSGTEDFSVTYTAYRDEKPIISGGRLIEGWQIEEVNGKTMWTVTLPEVQSGKWYFNQLWVNGQRRTRARYPNEGYLEVATVPEAKGQQWTQGVTSFNFRAGDLPEWSSVSGGEVVVAHRWTDSHLPITRIDRSRQTINFSKKSRFFLEPGDLYYVENVFEALDTPGEWYLNRDTGKLYYMPMSGEDIETTEAIAPVLRRLITLAGQPKQNRYINYINFENLTFAHAHWEPPKELSGYGQAADGALGVIYAVGSQYCKWENCTIAHIGSYGLELAQGCQNNQINESEFFDLGAGGIKISSSLRPCLRREKGCNLGDVIPTHSNQVTNCHIYDGGRIYHGAVGIWVGHSYNNEISRNHIHDFYYSGISVGWTWGYAESLARDNLVELNHIHDIGKLSNGDGPILSDMGGIYTLGVQRGTVVRGNTIHDVSGFRYGGRGFHLDGGSSYILVEKNLVYRTTHAGFHQNYGQENIARNNIFAFGREEQISCNQPEDHISFIFENNIVYWREGKLLNLLGKQRRLEDYNFDFERNLYWRVGGNEIMISSQEQALDLDQQSIVADPLFVDPEEGDFELQSDSPAFEIGFEPISDLLDRS